ncbi:hypothetical protein ACFU67_13140 [Streptomyces rhizosphaericola]|uniref:hypothetical protein n=1 Tax=Streptomyces rhizosphaericola TaxID=2564098 RepID=UPI0036BD3324
MSARDDLTTYAATTRTITADSLAPYIDALEKAAYDRAIEAVRAEYLTDDTGTPEDEAYNQGISDAIVAIDGLVEIDALNEQSTT